MASGGVVAAVARLARRLPLAPRLALRDAVRHRGRTAPAVAAVMAAVAGTTAVTLYVTAQQGAERAGYRPSGAIGTVTVLLTSAYTVSIHRKEWVIAFCLRFTDDDSRVFRSRLCECG